MPSVISGSVVNARRQEPLVGTTVLAFSVDHPESEDFLGKGEVDAKGAFEITYRRTDFVKKIIEKFPDGGSDIFLVVNDPDGDELHRSKAIKGAARFKPVKLLVDLPRRKPAPLGDVVKSGGFSPAAATRIERSGLEDLSALLRMKAAGKLGDLGLARADQEKLGTVTRLAALGGSASLAGKMQKAGLASPARLLRLASADLAERIERQSGKLDDGERKALVRLQRNIRRVKQRVGQASVLAARRQAADKDWKGGSDRPETVLGARPDDDLFPKHGGDALCRACDQCESIFSPTAYVYDLLTFIEDGFGVEPADVGKIIGQELDLDCEAALAPVKQIVLGIEVLERFALVELSITSASIGWQSSFQDGAVGLLAVVGIDASASPLPAAHTELVQLAKTTAPTLSTIMALRDKSLAFGSAAITDALPLPAEPAANAGDDAEAAFLMESAQVDAERATRLADQASRLDGHVDQLLVLYRQALIDKVVTTSAATASLQALERNLFIDLAAAPCQLTSCILQIIQSLQSLLLSVRTGSFASLTRAALQPFKTAFNKGDFDEESWIWLKTYRSWNAAIYALVYTENILSPPVERRRISGFFRDRVVPRLLRGQASAGAIEALDEDYAAYFRRIAKISPVASHVVDDRLYIFARSGESGDHALWLNIVDTRDLYVPFASQATMRDRLIDASGWFEIVGWNTDLLPKMAMPFGDDEDLAFIALGGDRTYRIDADGRLEGEVTFELPANHRDMILSADNAFGRHVPTLWVEGDGDGLWRRAELNEATGEWGDWIDTATPWFGQAPFIRSIPDSSGGTTEVVGFADTLIGNARCRVGKIDGQSVALSYDPTAGTTQPFVTKRLNGLEAGQSFGSYSVALSWMRSDLDLPGFLVIRRTNGDIFVQAVWLNTDSADPSFMLPMSSRLDAFAETVTWPASVDVTSPEGRGVDLRDRYLYYPLLAAWALNRAGDFVTAHDCYRRLYDPFAAERQVFPFDQAFSGELERADDWLATIQDPDAIARGRTGTYLRHVILMMVKNLIDWADHQFTLNTPESLNRARDLYRLAETVLEAPALRQDCATEVTRLERIAAKRFRRTLAPTDDIGDSLPFPVRKVAELRRINDRKLLEAAVTRLDKAFAADSSGRTLRRSIAKTVDEALKAEAGRHQEATVKLLDRFERTRSVIDRLLDLGTASQKHGEADADQGRVVPTHAPPDIGAALHAFCVPKNPLLDQLSVHIATRRILLANCLDINGEPNRRPTLPIGSLEGRVITTFGQLAAQAAGPIVDAPHYRYSFLVEKARQHVSLAQQLEAMMLAAIEKRDAAALATLQAEIAEELADATVNLKALATEEVELGVGIAVSQLARAQTELDFWTQRTQQGFMGLNASEAVGMGLMLRSGQLQALAALGYFLLAAPQVALGVAGGVGAVVSGIGGIVTAETGAGALIGIGGVIAGVAAIGAAAATGGQTILSGVQAAAGAAGTFGNLSLTFASFERRFEDWQHQSALAGIDRDVAVQQLALSERRVDVALQDEAIARLQQGHARLILEFHRNRFSNEQLYQWMIGVLQGAYRDVMQRATATARLAQRALMFERQEEITEIGGDYWSIDEASLSEGQRASGLLGAERLLTAITRLDAWKIKTDKRRLQLAKTLSLAHSFPSEFIAFKTTGRMQFHTLMDAFDQDYPGHYLRLIKSVRVAVLALVSPLDGIHATLANDGFSSVVKPDGGGTFVKLPAVQRLPQQVALDAASGDNGLFVLDYNDPLLLPFEGLGVETGWTLDLPRAANSFNYDSLVDVLVTIEYTALPSAAYRQQVVARLGTKRRVDRVLSLRDSFPDQWYHLHNPIDPSAAQTVTIDLPAFFFQQSAGDPLGIRHMMIILGGEAGTSRSGDLTIAKAGITPPLDVVTDADGIFNSRSGAPLDADGLPKPRFALDPNDPTRLLAPSAAAQNAALLDPRGEWHLTFDPAWFVGNDGDRDIDRLTDIILIPTLEYDVTW
ncbi:MAG: neuraminidase-like domain-containing protein [Alphaproteobacteria bacterium]